MALPGCYGIRSLVAVRASILNDDGSRICPNVDGSAFAVGGVIKSDASRVVDTGQTDTQRDGDGNVCNTKTNPDVVTGIRGSLELCVFDAELIEVLTGARLLTSGGTTIGFEEPSASATQRKIEFHTWSRAWSGSGQAAAPYNYLHAVYFATKWRLGDTTFEENALKIPLSFTGESNLNINIGSFDDIPPLVVGDGFSAQFLANDVPVATDAPYNGHGLSCGYVDTPSCTSS